MDLGVLSQLDVAPTVLALLGLPVAVDMPGRLITPIIAPANVTHVGTIASYGEGRHDADLDLPSPGEADYEARLRSLGYIE